MAQQGNGWYNLLAIQQERVDTYMEERRRGPLSCPNDGEPLTSGPDGRLFCRFDGWRPEEIFTN